MSSVYIDYVKTKQIKDMFGVRHIQAFLLAGAILAAQVQQSNIGISTMAMTKDKSKSKEGENWNKDEQNKTYGSYYYSLIGSCILAGYLSTKWDVKVMLLISTAIGTIVSYLTPTLIRNYNLNIFFCIKLLQGLSKGFVRPLVYTQLVRWLPPDELMLMGPVVLSCNYLGNGISFMMGGYLSTGQGGWPSIFYFSGNLGLIWCLAYVGLGSQSPNSCFYISAYERRYIEECLPSAIRSPYRESIPWRKIITCIPLYALIIGQMASNYGTLAFIMIVTMYYETYLDLDVKTVGLAMGLPFIGGSFLVAIQYQAAKFMIKRKKLNYSEIRHIANGIGQFGAFYFVMYSAFSTNFLLFFTLVSIGIAISSFQFTGLYMNYFDLAPNFIGVITGLCYGFGQIGSVMGSYASFRLYEYYLLDHSGPQSPMQAKEAVFFFVAIFYLCSGILWELFGSTKIQPFNDIKERNVVEEEPFHESEIIKT